MSIINEHVQRKWSPIIEHEELPEIKDSYKKAVLAVLLENQESAMRQQQTRDTASGSGLFLTEAPMQWGTNGMGGDAPSSASQTAGGWVDPVLISLVRRTMPNLISYDVCGVQPMSGPTGLIFAMRSQYGSPAQQGQHSSNPTPNEAFYNEANTAYSGQTGTHQTTDPITALFSLGTDSANTAEFTGQGAPTASAEMWNVGGYNNTGDYGIGSNGQIPEMSFSIERVAVNTQTRKLKGEYSLELAQDLKNTHGLDAESELANILSNEIIAEINREVLRTIYVNAKVGARTATGTTTDGVYDLMMDADGRWSVEKYKGLMFRLEREANYIAKETRRGKGNIIITSSDCASALQMAGLLDYSSKLSNNMKIDDMGNTFAGVLNGQFKVYIDPYLPTVENQLCVVGYKGSSAYDAGLFYCPYVPLTMMKAVGQDNFQSRIGFLTRYGLATNPFSEGTTVPSRDPQRITPHSNVYYRKFQVSNLM